MSSRPQWRPGRPDRLQDRWRAPVDGPGVLRLFFAVPVPAVERARIGDLMEDVQAAVRDGSVRVRWVSVAGLHLTLRFLGPTPEDRQAPLSAGADSVAADQAPFEVALSGGGAFPSIARPRSLWIGVTEGVTQLAGLADALTDAAAACGLTLDTRPFAPHLTVARTDGLRDAPAVARRLEDAAREIDLRFTADRVVLYRSILGRGPAQYEPLHESRLAG